VLVTNASVFWLFLLPVTLRGQATHPYIGILIFWYCRSLFSRASRSSRWGSILYGVPLRRPAGAWRFRL
jgi:hypothetical protein